MQIDRTPSDALSDSDILIAWGSDSDGLIAWSSPAWRRFTGISAEQQTQHQWQTCIHPEDLTAFDMDATGHSSQLQRMASEFRLLHNDGTFHPVLGYVHCSLAPTSRGTGFHAACFEIQATEIQATEIQATEIQATEIQATRTSGLEAATPDQSEESPAEFANKTGQPVEFDHQTIRDLFDNDAKSLRELAELFDATCEESLEFLATAFTTPNQQDLFSTAHRLKGAIANMYAPQVLESCQRLEEAVQANEISTAEKISQQVIRSVVQLQGQVKKEFTT